jgi:hypothetical protein
MGTWSSNSRNSPRFLFGAAGRHDAAIVSFGVRNIDHVVGKPSPLGTEPHPTEQIDEAR